MKLFELHRIVDESGISGTGVVAQGVIFDNGWCAMAWLTVHTSVAFYTGIDEVIAIHGHNGKTRVVQVADCAMAAVEPLLHNRIQDECEGVGNDFIAGNHLYMWEQREKLCRLFDKVHLAAKAQP